MEHPRVQHDDYKSCLLDLSQPKKKRGRFSYYIYREQLEIFYKLLLLKANLTM